jgi:hypothetical protein
LRMLKRNNIMLRIKRNDYIKKLSTYFLNGVYSHLIKIWLTSDTIKSVSPELHTYAIQWRKEWEKSARSYFRRMLDYIDDGNVVGTKKDKGYMIALQDFFVSNDVEIIIDEFLKGYDNRDTVESDMYKLLDGEVLAFNHMSWVQEIKGFLSDIFSKTYEENTREFDDVIKSIES